MREDKEINDRLLWEEKDEIDAVIPPPDIVAFNESRSCADLFRLYQKGQLEIKPKFQREVVWTNKEQALFVDSLIKQLPIPSICISLDIKTQKRLVIDGLQRLWTIIHFLNFENEDWKLPKCKDIDPELSNQKVSYIANNKPMLFDKLENLTIPITVLRCDYDNPHHMDYLFQIFRRLNSGGSKLLNQEIRNCIYSGSFNKLLKEAALSDLWMQFAGVNKNKVENSRFSNEERILRFFAFFYKYNDYNGRLASFLNDFMGEHRELSEEDCTNYTNLLNRVLSFATKHSLERQDVTKSKNLADAILVGIAHNIDNIESLEHDKVIRLFEQLTEEPEFSKESTKEDLGGKEKVKNRITKAIEVFSRG